MVKIGSAGSLNPAFGMKLAIFINRAGDVA
jgi:hypothetical protein